jgi:phage baseplate assembly protein W
MSSNFLGRGLKFPLMVDSDGQIEMSENEQDIRQAIRIILQTAKGERVMRPDFGSELHEYVFASINASTIGEIQAAVRKALVAWEPRIQVLTVEVLPLSGNVGGFQISLDYRIRSTNSAFNLVFPFYVKDQL